MMQKIDSLRKIHPRFIYESFDIAANKGVIDIQYLFKLEPNIIFRPRVSVPHEGEISAKDMKVYAFNLGLVEAISYWKAACPGEFIVRSGYLTSGQIKWWRDLFIHGLGEFFFQNKIDFKPKNFLKIKNESGTNIVKCSLKKPNGDLILAGGGIDSAVTLELLKKSEEKRNVLLLNPTIASLAITEAAGYKEPLVATRIIDPNLLELNSKGYLNGHTPFSAYLAFLGVFVAALNGFRNAIVSNERSADEGNIMYRGVIVNHQYSKSSIFENLFRSYCRKYLCSDINYFSFLRPLYELQITKIFARFPKYFEMFRSCNAGSKNNTWCGKCAKCAFSYLSLYPFVGRSQVIKIFGSDYFRRESIKEHIRALTGLVKSKPFDCVGTVKESMLAVSLSDHHFVKKDARGIADIVILSSWNRRNNLPSSYKRVLKAEVN